MLVLLVVFSAWVGALPIVIVVAVVVSDVEGPSLLVILEFIVQGSGRQVSDLMVDSDRPGTGISTAEMLETLTKISGQQRQCSPAIGEKIRADVVHDIKGFHLLLEGLEVRDVREVCRLPVELIEGSVDEVAGCPLRDGKLELGVIPMSSLDRLTRT